MKSELKAFGFCCSLFVMPALADDGRVTAPGNADGPAAEKQMDAGTSTMASDAESGAAAGKGTHTSTPAAAGYLYDQVKKGNVKIEGATDTEIPLTQ